jgi:hypothetical protein
MNVYAPAFVNETLSEVAGMPFGDQFDVSEYSPPRTFVQQTVVALASRTCVASRSKTKPKVQ